MTTCGRGAHMSPKQKRRCDPKNCPVGFKHDSTAPGVVCFYLRRPDPTPGPSPGTRKDDRDRRFMNDAWHAPFRPFPNW